MKQFQIILGLILFASVSTFAQSPRIKLNQITKDTVKGSVLISNPSDSGMVYSRDFYIAYGADTVLILYGDTLAATSGTISSVLSDGVTITGNGTSGNELKVDTSIIATIKALNDSLATVSASTTPDGVTITGDGSVGNPLKVDTLLISTIQGLVDTLTARGYLTAEVDGSITNELQTISTSGAAGNITLSDGGGTLNLNVDDADASATNEGSLTVGAGTASTSVISSNTSGSTDVTLTAGSNITLSETGNNITIASTGGGTTFNNISETADTVFIDKFLNVDTSTLYVDATNNRVGIGTASPSAKLTVEGKTIIRPESTTSADIEFAVQERSSYADGSTLGLIEKTADNGFSFIIDSTGSGFYLDNEGNKNTVEDVGSGSDYVAIKLWDNNIVNTDNDLVIDNYIGDILFSTLASSNIGIGTKTPAYKLDVVGDINASGEVRNSGVILTSDARYKKDITTLYNATDKLMVLNPVSYYWNDLMLQKMEQSKSKTKTSIKYGLVAQEVEAIMPEFVSTGEDGYKAIDYQAIITLLIKSNQEQQTEIDQLKTLITDLTNRLTILENK